MGFQRLAEPQETLKVMLVAADMIRQKTSFFVEAYCEPQEAVSKTSRTHCHKMNSCDLGCEQLEIDWHGDEDELVIEVVEFSGAGKDKPLGEIRLDRATVEKYAREAAANAEDVSKGARSFKVARMDEHIVKLRQNKLMHPDPASVIESFALSKAQKNVGLGVGVDEDEVLRLREENKKLKAQVSLLETGHKGCQSDTLDEIMRLVLRFEIIPRKTCDLEIQHFAEQSFYEVPDGDQA